MKRGKREIIGKLIILLKNECILFIFAPMNVNPPNMKNKEQNVYIRKIICHISIIEFICLKLFEFVFEPERVYSENMIFSFTNINDLVI